MNDTTEGRSMKIHHCAISVPDIEESLAWYATMLGFEVVWRTKIPGLDVDLVQMRGAGFLRSSFKSRTLRRCPRAGAIPIPTSGPTGSSTLHWKCQTPRDLSVSFRQEG